MIFNYIIWEEVILAEYYLRGVIFWGAPLFVEVDTKSTKLTTNRCWTRAMGGEQETHIGGFSLIKSDQDKDDLQKKRNYIKYSSTFFLVEAFSSV